MKKILLLVLIILFISVECFAGNSGNRAVIARRNVAEVGDGEIGSTTATQTLTISVGTAYFDIATTGTAGNVRYAHVSIDAADGTETVCVSLQADSDAGTVHLSGSGTAPASGWLNIDMGSSYEIQAATNYRIVIQTNDAISIDASTFGTGDLRQDAGYSYDCGGSVTNDSQNNQRIPAIIFNNSSGDPS